LFFQSTALELLVFPEDYNGKYSMSKKICIFLNWNKCRHEQFFDMFSPYWAVSSSIFQGSWWSKLPFQASWACGNFRLYL